MTSSPSLFSGVPEGAKFEVVEMCRRFAEDTHPLKQNLSIGGYQNAQGRTHLFPVVRQVEQDLAGEADLEHGYLPTLGYPEVNRDALRLLLGRDHPALERSFGLQSIGGTGPIRVAAEFLREHLGLSRVLYSDPTWMSHRDIFLKAGFSSVEPYGYFNRKTWSFDLALMLSSLSTAEPDTVVILHAAAHNPTGVDPTRDDWQAILDVVKERRLFPLFDCAYQGFATGDLDADAWPVRHFAARGLELFVSQSFGKNMGLYGERIGFLCGVLSTPAVLPAVLSQLTRVVRPMYSNPAGHGAKIVGRVLADPDLFEMWRAELRAMVARVKKSRVRLRSFLELLYPAKDWSALTRQVGMFFYSDLTQEQGEALMNRHHVYMLPSSGRINMGAVTESNVEYVARAIADVVKD